MLVYGDHRQARAPRAMLADILAVTERAAALPAGLVRHACLIDALIEAGGLVQGLADAAFAERGCDDVSPQGDAAMALLLAIARAVCASWQSGFAARPVPPANEAAALGARILPPRIEVKLAEGFAFYTLYPEAFWEAARQLPPARWVVIGLRSIGAPLAAMAAVALGAEAPVTLRPTGHPFDRRLRLSGRLSASLLAPQDAHYAVVDEGPGLSGSSFGAVADFLEDAGVPRRRIAFLPGHGGMPGPQVSARHLARWQAAVRPTADVPAGRLAGWVADLVGHAVAPLRDLSGGAWRGLMGRDPAFWPPADPVREKPKFLLATDRGQWLLKFAGLGRFGEQKLALAQALHEAGLGSQPAGLRHGFLVERWQPGLPATRAPRPALLDALARSIGLRQTFPAAEGAGAGFLELARMAATNIGHALGPEAADAWQRRTIPAPHGRPVRVDARMHAWEWRALGGRLLKADALDHAYAHDLVGCQPAEWDVAGACVEWQLTAPERAWLLAHTGLSDTITAWLIPVYLAFQVGLWSRAAADAAGAEQARIGRLLARYRAGLAHELCDSLSMSQCSGLPILHPAT